MGEERGGMSAWGCYDLSVMYLVGVSVCVSKVLARGGR